MEKIGLISEKYSFDELLSGLMVGMPGGQLMDIDVVKIQDDLLFVTWNNYVCYVPQGAFLIKNHKGLHFEYPEGIEKYYTPHSYVDPQRKG